jgi:hypothetical protein
VARKVRGAGFPACGEAATKAMAARKRDPIRVWGLQEIYAGEKTVA